jgi:hypothetical protein
MHPDLCALPPIPTKTIRLQWFWYWVIIVMSGACFCLFFIFRIFSLYYYKNKRTYRCRFAFYHARKLLNNTEKKERGSDLYSIFITLFADWFMLEKSYITEKLIKEKLVSLGLLSEDGLESWNRFWYKVVHMQYGFSPMQKADKTLYTEARLWIIAFSKVGLK